MKKRLWCDLGDIAVFRKPSSSHDRWADHGEGLLLTILKNAGIEVDMISLRMLHSFRELPKLVQGYDQLIMNVRSYTYPVAYKTAQIFKQVNPAGIVMTGGMHSTVAPNEMDEVQEFDHIIRGAGERVIVDLVKDPSAFPRHYVATGSKSIDDWPFIDRTLWPNPHLPDFPWPLEPQSGWGPAPVATVITSRVCPWQCTFCNESAYIASMGRRSVDRTIEELNFLDDHYGPIGSVVIHDSMFFQQPKWLEEWLDKYPRKANKLWPYWAAGRSDTVRQWPDLFEALVRETNWNTVSIGFESGSDRVLKILNKECTVEDNYFTIDLLNRIGDDMKAQGKEPPKFWSNIMLAIPGETHEDAFDTIRMMKRMKYSIPSIAYYAPYPGSALGYQLISEGKSLMSKENYHRYAGDEKVRDVDYHFYRELLGGVYKSEIDSKDAPYGYDVYADSLVKA
jgi:anaerobic magnesium-protoporphyrin IX monomethyl ester cyclase